LIAYAKNKSRHVFSMSQDDLNVFAEVVWLLKHTPPPVGFNRRPFTVRQSRLVEELYDRIGYPENYNEIINLKHNQ